MSRNMWLVGAMVALAGPLAMAQSRPTSLHAVGTDGSVYYADRAAGTVIRVSPDGSSQVVANEFDGPTGVEMESSGNLIVGDEVGVHRIFLNRGTKRLLRALPTAFEPQVRFDQANWTYRESRGKVTVRFTHNLQELSPSFEIQVSRDGGQSWTPAASGLKRTVYTWNRPDDQRDASNWPLTTVRFRVTAYVNGEVVCSDVSDKFEAPTQRANGQ